MSRITLIYTRHEESGNCNSSQLLKIIERVQPEVIFEELSQANFQRAYNDETLHTLETTAIKRYITCHDVVHIPVDTFPRGREHDENVNRLYSILTSGITQDAFQLRQLIRQLSDLSGEYGFNFLNSSENDEYLNNLNSLKSRILELLKNDRLNRIHESEIQMINDRERQILRNIYTFKKENSFNEGLMFIGSGHRRSFPALIKKFKDQERLKLIWRNYPFA
jgi:hypothetical protein